MIKFTDLKYKSNQLSLVRLLLAAPVWITIGEIPIENSYRWITFALLFAAAITDYLDGHLARKYNEITETGKLLDPLADKVLMGIIVIRLFQLGMIPDYLFWIILLRDIIIFTAGLIVSKILGKILPSNRLGKITVFILGIFVLLVISGVSETGIFYVGFLYLSIILCFASLLGYAIRVFDIFKWGKNESV